MSARCTVPGCGGPLDIRTDGAGRVVETCPRCEKREAWVRANTPKVPLPKCVICEGPVAPSKSGARGRRARKYCEACGVAKRRIDAARSAKKYADAQRRKVIPLRQDRRA